MLRPSSIVELASGDRVPRPEPTADGPTVDGSVWAAFTVALEQARGADEPATRTRTADKEASGDKRWTEDDASVVAEPSAADQVAVGGMPTTDPLAAASIAPPVQLDTQPAVTGGPAGGVTGRPNEPARSIPELAWHSSTDSALKRPPTDQAEAVAPATPADRAAEDGEQQDSSRVRSRIRPGDVGADPSADHPGTPVSTVVDRQILREAIERPPVADAVDRVLSQVFERIRTVPTKAGPGLETTIHDPELGSIRLVVTGLPGELIRATLIAGSGEAVLALRHAIRNTHTTSGLANIDLRIQEAGTIFPHGSRLEPDPDPRPDARGGDPGQTLSGNAERRDQRRGEPDPTTLAAPLSTDPHRPTPPVSRRHAANRLGRTVDRNA